MLIINRKVIHAGWGRIVSLIFFAVIATWSAGALAQDEDLIIDTPRDYDGVVNLQPKQALQYANTTAARVNPVGFVNVFDVAYHFRLYKDRRNALAQNFAGIGITTGITPVMGRIGVAAQIQPVSVFNVYAKYMFAGYFGTMDLVASFDSADADFWRETLAERAEQPGTENYAAIGHEALVGTMLRFKFGPIAVRDNFDAFYANMDLRDSDVVFYDQAYDMLIPNKGWTLINNLDVIWASNFGMLVGARYHLAYPIYQDRHYGAGVDPNDAPSNGAQSVGFTLSYIFRENPGSTFEAPTIVLRCMWHLVSRYRAGQEVSQWVPQLALAFQFKGSAFVKP